MFLRMRYVTLLRRCIVWVSAENRRRCDRSYAAGRGSEFKNTLYFMICSAVSTFYPAQANVKMQIKILPNPPNPECWPILRPNPDFSTTEGGQLKLNYTIFLHDMRLANVEEELVTPPK